MAMGEVAIVKQVMLSDLDDYLIQKWMSKMSITEQTAITRVCKRIKANAYKLTTIMFANELPDDFRIELIPKLPKLKKIGFIIPQESWDVRMDMRLRLFLRSLAIQNPKIERMVSLPSEYKSYFVGMVKVHHEDYDGSTFKTLISEVFYEKLLKKFPGIETRHRIFGTDHEQYTTGMRPIEQRLSDPNLCASNVSTTMPDYDFNDILTLTTNLTELYFSQTLAQVRPSFAQIFDSVINLPLKKFKLEVIPDVVGKIFSWVQLDFDSFRSLLELNSLVDITLRFPQCNKTYSETLKCFLNCSRNNFHHFSSHTLYDEFSVSNFVFRKREPQLFPSMFLGLQNPGLQSANDTFPIVQFIQKFSPKYREYEFSDRKTMVKMIKSCSDLIRNQPKINFAFYANHKSKWTISFSPFQLEEGKMKFSVQMSPSQYIKKMLFVHKKRGEFRTVLDSESDTDDE